MKCKDCEYFCKADLLCSIVDLITLPDKECHPIAKILKKQSNASHTFDLDDGWISVKDELPPTFQEILFKYNDNEPSVDVLCSCADYHLDGFVVGCNETGYKDVITHWKPLPEKQREKKPFSILGCDDAGYIVFFGDDIAFNVVLDERDARKIMLGLNDLWMSTSKKG